ncbi:MAG: DUF4423 domain-containing protein [Proteobacteria bacterium]|nr:MAG: DUF4423 domain-containing protein [Pseudomonadota bacterium]
MDIDRMSSYHDILRYQFEQFKGVKGYRTLLANKLGFHPSHLSHVLSGSAHLSHEQGMALALEWKFKDLVTNLFLNLISLARSETDTLKKFYAEKVELDRKSLEAVAMPKDDRHLADIELDFKQSFIFLSHWRYAAIIAHLEFGPMKDLSQIAFRLGLNEDDVSTTLQDLREMGLVELSEDVGWNKLEVKYNVLKDKRIVEIFNRSMREKGGLAQDFGGKFTPIRIAQVATCNSVDTLEIRRKLTEVVIEIIEIMTKSEKIEDDGPHVVSFCLDLFRI